MKILKIMAAVTSSLIVMLMIAVGCTHKQPEVEPVRSETVGIRIIEEETTSEEETTVAAVTTSATSVAIEETTEPETEVPSYSVEEMADYVLDHGINGPEREEFCGDRYDEVQAYIDATHVPPVRYEEPAYDPGPAYYEGGDVLTPSAGVCYFEGHMETYYNLDMSGVIDIMYNLGYDGEYWVRADGCKMLGEYIMCAADFGWLPRGSIVETSLGTGIVCDTGAGGWNWLDVATCW